ncbi:MAG TPA: DUF3300 domain-containing protein [Bryobacteraceae bacterium]|nr:DUF3300 domain-containing protein [Bryobacteraceae bacterium]
MRTLQRAVFNLLPMLTAAGALAQAPPPPPPLLPPAQLDTLVSRIALYPDPLLAQALAAATYYNEIPEAARWADQHHYLTGQALASAIQADQLPWDPSVQALLPFPSVLDMMASDPGWTQQIGSAFMTQQQDVMDAVQRERVKASNYGYLRTNSQIVVSPGPYITILPANPNFIVVPAYDPAIVFFPPRPGFVVAGGIHFGFGITIGAFFRPWGWGYNSFDWGRHVVVINNAPWRRAWDPGRVYAHPYAAPVRRFEGPRPAEPHALRERTPAEREAPRRGERGPREEHREERR